MARSWQSRFSRRGVVVLLALVSAVQSADTATAGATAAELTHKLGFSATEVGLLASVAGLVGAVGTVPMGMLADRARRIRLLAIGTLTWAVAMALVGLSDDFVQMLLSRTGLGLVTAILGPVAASLIGEQVPLPERGRAYSRVLFGELVGTGAGFLVSGELAGTLGWRWAYWWLAVVSAGIGLVLLRIPEPARQHRTPGRAGLAEQLAAARTILAIRSNRLLIVASALGYFFFAGLQTFGISYLRKEFRLSQVVAAAVLPGLGVAAVAGVLVGGRLGDRLQHRWRTGRLRLAIVAFGCATVLFAATFSAPSLLLALACAVPAAAFMGAVNPPLDAARVDIVPQPLLGRAESIRTLLRNGADSLAPVAFGVTAHGVGLRGAFLVMLVPLAAAGAIGASGLRSYPADVDRAQHADPADADA